MSRVAERAPVSRASGTDPGTVAMLLGIASAGFGALALLVVGLQRGVLATMQAEDDPFAVDFVEVASAYHTLFGWHMPVWIVVGLWLVIAGNGVRRRSARSVGPLRAASVAAILAVLAYVAHALVGALPPFAALFARATGDAGATLVWALGVAGSLGALAPVLPFVWIIRRLRSFEPAARAEPERAR